MVNFLEAQLVAQEVLVEVSAPGILGLVSSAEGFPFEPILAVGDLDQRVTTRVGAAVVDLIHGDVWEKRRLGGHSTRGQPSRRGDEHPMVRARDQAHEERRHLVHVADGVVPLALERQKLAGYVVVADRRLAHLRQCARSLRSDAAADDSHSRRLPVNQKAVSNPIECSSFPR